MRESINFYHMPGSCSTIVLNALEEACVDFDDHVVDLAGGEQKLPGFLEINPRGKVPVLVHNGYSITETAVICNYLAGKFEAAKLLPRSGNGAVDALGLSDLVWCSSTLHPAVHRIFRPEFYAPECASSAKGAAISLFVGYAKTVEQRVLEERWWYGTEWSIMDVYLYWIFAMADQFGFALDDFPGIRTHRLRVEARPSFAKAQAREKTSLRLAGLDSK